MHRKPRTFSPPSAAGTTLVEVVAGLALLGSLLVGLLMAKARFTRQAAVADRRMQAIAAADSILSAWHRDPKKLVRNGAGTMSDDPSLAWRSQIVANPPIEDLGGQVVRLEMIDRRDGGVLVGVDYVAEPPPKVEAVGPAKSPGAATAAPSPRRRPHAPGVHTR